MKKQASANEVKSTGTIKCIRPNPSASQQGDEDDQMTQTVRRSVSLCIAFLLLLGASSAPAQTVQEIARKAFSSTVLLVMEDANGQPLSLGSGFLVRAGEIASNLHVVEGAARGYAKLVGQETKHDIQGFTAVDPARDLVVLKISATGSPTLPIGSSDAVRVGEPVYAVGNPLGLEGTFSQGIVSSIRQVGTDKLLQITAPISPGSSGGPVLNGKGEVIGVSVATFRGGQNLNFAIPSDYLEALLTQTGPVKPLAQAESTGGQRSILSDLEGSSSEGVVASHFAWDRYSWSGRYMFSVRNQLREPVRDVICLVIFYASDGLPIETEIVTIRGPIGGNLAKRSEEEGRYRAQEVRDLTARVELRVLDFRLAE
ncbi:MAG: trypsin-like peptidase domain-containing protein [Truepera sp.]|nr:trypsin-like peptidase domain-containing protein [Truepera sp.]